MSARDYRAHSEVLQVDRRQHSATGICEAASGRNCVKDCLTGVICCEHTSTAASEIMVNVSMFWYPLRISGVTIVAVRACDEGESVTLTHRINESEFRYVLHVGIESIVWFK